ncbi:hypothetical protein SBRCBS47491_005142 [Sporothrix bragantina]|uniref:Mitochondrial export translocase n=1 Tax=Sporothrix bragantina TaxID=671064 RepID=A0ABP0BVT7_9PEZI
MAQPSAHSVRALRAAWVLPAPAPAPSQCSSQQNLHRSFSTSRTTSTPHNLCAQYMRPRRPALSSWPPCCHNHAQTGLWTHISQGRRNFHFATIANATVDAAEATILQLHAVTHTPWYITVPLVALGVNLVFRLPFSVHAREIAIKRARLGPLLQAWTTVHSQEVIKERKTRSMGYMSMSSVQAEVIKRFKKTSNRVFSAFGVQQWKLYGNILALPPWLVIIEAIRRMCGAPTGLLGMILRSSGSTAVAEAAAAEATTAATAASASSDAVDVASIASTVSPQTVPDSVSALIDPTFATGGCLWFPDLTVADPYHILPFALSAMLVVNILPSTDIARRSLFGLSAKSGGVPGSGNNTPILVESVAARALQRALLIMSIFVGPLTLHFPAAIHLYWLSSAAVTYMITRAIRIIWPVPRIIANSGGLRDLPWIVPPVSSGGGTKTE